jgi:UBX domain-containing protein 1
VQNPDRGNAAVPGGDVVRDLLRRAAEGGPPPPPPGGSGPGARPGSGAGDGGVTRRWGAGNTLGSDDVESSFVPDPQAPPPGSGGADEPEPQVRHITFWREGFSVEDGPLMRYDDPANSQVLNEINSGCVALLCRAFKTTSDGFCVGCRRAPPSILNVQPGQPVELRVARRLNEAYVPPPTRPVAAFSGQGARLGSVVPNPVTSAPGEPLISLSLLLCSFGAHTLIL